jgi:PAS domain S-box-containing protein
MTDNSVEIRELVDSFLRLLDQTSVPAAVTDNHGIIMVNTLFLHVTEYRIEELYGKKCRELEAIEDLVEIQRRKKYMRSDQGHYQGFTIIKDKQGKEYFCRVNIDRIASDIGNGAFYLKQFHLLNQNKAEEFKDLVKIRNTIENQLPEIKDVFALARIVNLDYRRILYLMKEYEAVTPKRYLNEVRLRRCLEMIEESKKTQKEIAFELGFCDESHLCNVFKDSMNMTITEYLKANCCENG